MAVKRKRQHYVPQVYLKGFANITKKKHLLFVYNKENKKSFKCNIKNIGQENYFYSFQEAQVIEV